MSKQLVLVHGRSQHDKDSVALKAEWLDALNDGLAKSGLSLPIPEQDVRFPYYGDTLRDLIEGASAETAAQVITRGLASQSAEEEFTTTYIKEVQKGAGITDEQVRELLGREVVQRGPENWEWVQGILKAVDRYVPFGSSTSIALFTHDVFLYLRDSALRGEIEDGVADALIPGHESIVVGHSLGSVVAYNLLRREAHLRDWNVPLFVTVGSPLGVGSIKKQLKEWQALRCPEGVASWLNAFDERDVVALYPLTPTLFPLNPLEPSIENKADVRNRTENRHGISGYLDNEYVARRIYDALVT